MCLAPEDKDGNAVDDEDEYAIEAISLTWKKGEPTTASALIRNMKRSQKVSSVSQVARLDRLFSSRVSQRMPSHTDRKYNYPYEPKAVDPHRKVKKVRHKDVIRHLRVVPREVVRLIKKVTNALSTWSITTWPSGIRRCPNQLKG